MQRAAIFAGLLGLFGTGIWSSRVPDMHETAPSPLTPPVVGQSGSVRPVLTRPAMAPAVVVDAAPRLPAGPVGVAVPLPSQTKEMAQAPLRTPSAPGLALDGTSPTPTVATAAAPVSGSTKGSAGRDSAAAETGKPETAKPVRQVREADATQAGHARFAHHGSSGPLAAPKNIDLPGRTHGGPMGPEVPPLATGRHGGQSTTAAARHGGSASRAAGRFGVVSRSGTRSGTRPVRGAMRSPVKRWTAGRSAEVAASGYSAPEPRPGPAPHQIPPPRVMP